MSLLRKENQNEICRASKILKLSMREMFALKQENGRQAFLRVPIFQRRYCWGEGQLMKLIQDTLNICSPPRILIDPEVHKSDYEGDVKATRRAKRKVHSLDRVVSSLLSTGDYCIIDGQQRCTTVCLLLSSIRDFCNKRKIATELSEYIDTILFPSGRDKECVLKPTYFDQNSFNAAMNGTFEIDKKQRELEYDDNVAIIREACDYVISSQLWPRVATIISNTPYSPNNDQLVERCALSFTQALLTSVYVLLFNMNEPGNAQSAYTRLAVRAALFVGMRNDAPGITMATTDLMRNLVVSFFPEDKQVEVYLAHWAPIEKLAMTPRGERMKRRKSITIEEGKEYARVYALEGMVQRFNAILQVLVDESQHVMEVQGGKETWTDPGLHSFPAYCKLLACIQGTLLSLGVEIPLEGDPTEEIQQAVIGVLVHLHKIAQNRLGT